ncbi:DUF3325 domain-containing protein [Halomonadaceae bacterium KBTZ08]
MMLGHGVVAVLSALGLGMLALAMERHGHHVLGQFPTGSQQRLWRSAGSGLLLLGWLSGVAFWGYGIGTVAWVGWLGVVGPLLALWLTRWQPTQSSKRKPKSPEAQTPAPEPRSPGRLLTFVLIMAVLPAAAIWLLPG